MSLFEESPKSQSCVEPNVATINISVITHILMLEHISRRAIGSHVSLTAIRVPNTWILSPHQHGHQQHPRTWPGLTPRPFTTTTTRQSPAHSPHHNVNVFVPPNATPLESQPINPQTGATPSSTITLPTLKPITTHHNLPTYQTHHRQRLLAAPDPQTRHKLNTSTVHLGTRYEYLIQSHLQSHLGFTLTRIGGRGDGGVDLIGTWTLPVPVSPPPSSSSPTNPTHPQPTFRILLQAKRMSPSRKPMPALMRELDGAILSAASARWISTAFLTHNIRTSSTCPAESAASLTSSNSSSSAQSPILSDLSHLPTLGILVTTRPLTPGIEQAMASSPRCLMYICLEEVDESVDMNGTQREDFDGGASVVMRTPATRVRQMVWNGAATRAGLRGYEVVSRFTDSDGGSTTKDREAVLVFGGQPVSAP